MRRSLTPFARTTAFTLFVLAVLSAAASAPAAVTIFTPGGLDAYFYDLQAEPNRRGAGTDLLNASPTHKNILQLSTLTPTV
ncbi:MAG: hypothetical protein H7210_06865, partial [Pyrinomonadaceae bacterium]|nr:hypothetical protein [Phycisphaerales bacterium]